MFNDILATLLYIMAQYYVLFIFYNYCFESVCVLYVRHLRNNIIIVIVVIELNRLL